MLTEIKKNFMRFVMKMSTRTIVALAAACVLLVLFNPADGRQFSRRFHLNQNSRIGPGNTELLNKADRRELEREGRSALLQEVVGLGLRERAELELLPLKDLIGEEEFNKNAQYIERRRREAATTSGAFGEKQLSRIHSQAEGVVSSTWNEKETLTFGNPFTILEMETRFENQPHVFRTVACPAGECVPSVEPPGCDFSDPVQCGAGCEEHPDYLIACDPSIKFTQLKSNSVEYIPYHAPNTYKQFRLYVPDPCETVVIDVSQLTGDPDIYLSYSPAEADSLHFDRTQGALGADRLIVCPDSGTHREMLDFIYAA